jgi:hypothetical protein
MAIPQGFGAPRGVGTVPDVCVGGTGERKGKGMDIQPDSHLTKAVPVKKLAGARKDVVKPGSPPQPTAVWLAKHEPRIIASVIRKLVETRR